MFCLSCGRAPASRSAWIATLGQIEDGPSPATLVRRIAELLGQPTHPRRGQIEAAAFLLHRRAATAHVGIFMRDLPAFTSVRWFLSVYMPTMAPVLADNAVVCAAAAGLSQTLLASDVAYRTLKHAMVLPAPLLPVQLAGFGWSRRAYKVLRRLRHALTSSDPPVPAATSPGEEVARQPAIYARDLIHAYIHELSQHICDPRVRQPPDAAWHQPLPEAAVGEKVADCARELGIVIAQIVPDYSTSLAA